MFFVVAAEEMLDRPALGVLHLAEGGFDLAGLGNQPVFGRVPNVDNEIVIEGNGVPLRQLP